MNAWWSQTFANDGGPLITLPLDVAHRWPGTQADYDRACDARRPFDLFPAGPGVIVVAASTDTMFYTANWLRVAGQPGITFVGWDTGGDGARDWLVPRLHRPGIDWRLHRPRVLVASGILLLQHAAGPAGNVRLARREDVACIGETVPVGVEPGRYRIETAAVDEEGYGQRYCCGLCRWVPTDKPARDPVAK